MQVERGALDSASPHYLLGLTGPGAKSKRFLGPCSVESEFGASLLRASPIAAAGPAAGDGRRERHARPQGAAGQPPAGNSYRYAGAALSYRESLMKTSGLQ